MKTLVAGLGNIFRRDDGLGSAVVWMLADKNLGAGVRVRDFGTGGMHLALEMLEGYDLVVIVDAVGRNDPPGTVFAIDVSGEEGNAGAADPHDMNIGALLALYRRLRAQSEAPPADPKIIVAGCVPQNLDDGMDLSEAVRAALPACVEIVCKIVTQSPIATGVPS